MISNSYTTIVIKIATTIIIFISEIFIAINTGHLGPVCACSVLGYNLLLAPIILVIAFSLLRLYITSRAGTGRRSLANGGFWKSGVRFAGPQLRILGFLDVQQTTIQRP